MGRVFALGALLAVMACNSVDSSADKPCGPSGECPTGYSCDTAVKLCVKSNVSTPDAAARDASVPDAVLEIDGSPPDAATAADAPPTDAVDQAPVVDAAVPDARREPDSAPPPDGAPSAAELTVSPTEVDFGPVVVGEASLPITFTVTNVGGMPSGEVSASMSDPVSYSVVGGTCAGASLDPGASCTVLVQFNP